MIWSIFVLVLGIAARSLYFPQPKGRERATDCESSDTCCLKADPTALRKYIFGSKVSWPIESDFALNYAVENVALFACQYLEGLENTWAVPVQQTKMYMQCPTQTSLQIVDMMASDRSKHRRKAFCINSQYEKLDVLYDVKRYCLELPTAPVKKGILAWTTRIGSVTFGIGTKEESVKIAGLTIELHRVTQPRHFMKIAEEQNAKAIEHHPIDWRKGDTYRVCALHETTEIVTLRAALVDTWPQ